MASAPDRVWSLRLPAGLRATGTEGDALATEEGAHFEVRAKGSVRSRAIRRDGATHNTNGRNG